jgi:hypothetical protein
MGIPAQQKEGECVSFASDIATELTFADHHVKSVTRSHFASQHWQSWTAVCRSLDIRFCVWQTGAFNV